jgi:hypothetical protein
MSFPANSAELASAAVEAEIETRVASAMPDQENATAIRKNRYPADTVTSLYPASFSGFTTEIPRTPVDFRLSIDSLGS